METSHLLSLLALVGGVPQSEEEGEQSGQNQENAENKNPLDTIEEPRSTSTPGAVCAKCGKARHWKFDCDDERVDKSLTEGDADPRSEKSEKKLQ